jgi:hypothetical protein
MNSGQSQKLAVGSMVSKYVRAAIAKATHPKMLFNDLNRFIFLFLFVDWLFG